MNFQEKYLKYKKRYLNLKNQFGGDKKCSTCGNILKDDDTKCKYCHTKQSSITYIQILNEKVKPKVIPHLENYDVQFEFEKVDNNYVKIDKTIEFGFDTYVSIFSNGFAIGRIMEYSRTRCKCATDYESGCECPPDLYWLICNAEKKLSNFILAYAIYTNELCESSIPIEIIEFIAPTRERKLLQDYFTNDLPNDIRDAFKHDIIKEASCICSMSYNDKSILILDIDDSDFDREQYDRYIPEELFKISSDKYYKDKYKSDS